MFGVIITPQTVFVNESGGNATYQVKLSSCPYSNVTCTTTVDGKQIQREPFSLRFDNSSRWDKFQDITVMAVDDLWEETCDATNSSFSVALVHSSVIQHTCTSEDTAYDTAVVPDVAVMITDNDYASVRIDPNALHSILPLCDELRHIA